MVELVGLSGVRYAEVRIKNVCVLKVSNGKGKDSDSSPFMSEGDSQVG